MSIYTGTDIQNLIALINAANPGLPVALDEANFVYGAPVTIAENAQGHNTSVKVVAKASSAYKGSRIFTYRRLDLSRLFRAHSPTVARYVGSGTVTLATVLGVFNKKYGLNLQVDKMVLDRNWSIGQTGQVRTMTARPNNYFYVGSTPITWIQDIQKLGLDILTTSDVGEATWPGGNDFDTYPDRTLQGELLLQGFEFTEYAKANNFGSANQAGTVTANAFWNGLLAHINSVTGLSLSAAAYDADTNPQGVGGYGNLRTPLPNAANQFANKPGMSYAYILNTENHPTFRGRIVIYYNL